MALPMYESYMYLSCIYKSHPDSVGNCIFRMLFLLSAIAHPLFHIRFMQNL